MKDEQKKTLVSAPWWAHPKAPKAPGATEAALCDGIEFARDLIAEPANILYPESFVEKCREALDGTGIEIVTLDEAEMRSSAWAHCSASGWVRKRNRACCA